MRTKSIVISCFVLLIIILFQSLGYPFWDTLKGYAVMYFYDKQVLKNSYLNEAGIRFSIPGGNFTTEKDWYPFMLHHDASSYFSQYTGRNLSCIILYSFGSFDFMKGSSNFYNPESPYEGAFYGGYAIFDHNPSNPPYGYDLKGELNIDEIQKLPFFDQTRLVLPAVGCPDNKIVFNSVETNIEKDVNYIGRKDWTRIDAIIKTNSPSHRYKSEKNIGYVQYGKPHKKFIPEEDYPMITVRGRIYVKYIDDLGGTFILYIMAKDQEAVDYCDHAILSHSEIAFKE